MASYVEDDTERILSNMDDATFHQESWSSSNSSDVENRLDHNSLLQSNRTFFENNFQDHSISEDDDSFEGFNPPLASTHENLTGALNSVLNRNEISNNFEETAVDGLAEPEWAPVRDNNPAEESLINATLQQNVSAGPTHPSIEILKAGSQKGHPALYLLPYCYKYTKDKKIKKDTLMAWKCVYRIKGCSARFWTNVDFLNEIEPATEIGQHSSQCIQQVGKKEIDDFKNGCKEMALKPENLFRPAKEIIEIQKPIYIPRGMPNEHLPSIKSLANIINYHRRKTRPKPPKADDLFFDLKVNCIPQDFYRGEVSVGPPADKRRHFLFSTTRQMELLRSAKLLKIDGTFKIVQRPHTQLLTVHANIKTTQHERNMPLFYILMSGKREVDYKRVLEEMKLKVEGGGNPMRVETILLDFEVGLWNAVRAVFQPTASGGQLKVRGCWFHYTQALMKMVGKCHLTKDYCKKQDIYKMVRRLMTMPLIDYQNIPILFDYYKNRYASHIQESIWVRKYFEYMEKQWITNAIITPESLSCFKEPIRTNNQVETFNGQIWSLSGKNPLHIYLLAFLLDREAHRFADELDQPISIYTKKCQQVAEREIKAIYTRYMSNETPKLSPREAVDRLMVATKKVLNSAIHDRDGRPLLLPSDDESSDD